MATILSGREVSADIQLQLKQKVERLGLSPKLTIVQVGDREDSNVYIRMKIKFAESSGVAAEHLRLPNTTTEAELISAIDRLNKDAAVHGIIVQLPLDSLNPISTDKITNLVSPDKDVDGLSDVNAGKVLHGQVDGRSCYLPCTPYGCMQLIRRSGVPIEGARAVVIGRSKIVGSPMAQLLIWANATVTVLHSRSRDVEEIVRQADILVVAIGKPMFVKKSWVKSGLSN
jgi:methylenetetrahydrofolate dehydrogenase (NADP+)/methenyltetrahydrofolate cyclohydrolase/formyltetrahydrofolate synthetase